MAERKFIIDNGFSTDADSEITGSLSVSGTVDASAFTVNGSALTAGGSSYSDADVETFLESNLTANRIQLRTNNSYFGVGTAALDAGMALKNVSGQPFFYGMKYQPANNGQTDLELEANPGGKINVNGYRVYNVATPTDNTDAANKAYVDSVASGGGSYGDSDVSSYLNGGWNFHLIPDTNATYDIGSAEKKVRHFYLSANSLTIGDTPFSEANVDRSMEVYVDEPAPVSSTAEGKKGDVRVVDGFMYVCVDTNTWVRLPVDTNW